MSEEKHKHYYLAITRLLANTPLVVDKGTIINNDSVAIEAGRQKGSIKSGRTSFNNLIVAINEARALQATSTKKPKQLTSKLDHKAEALKYRELLEASIGREIMLERKIYELEAKLDSLHAPNIIHLRKR